MLTPIHPLVLRLCIQSKCYHAGLPLLNSYSYTLDSNSTLVTGEDIRTFYYSAGVVYIGLERYVNAIEHLCHVLAFPAVVSSVVQVAAYKKFVLVSLILSGKVGKPGRFTQPGALRQIKMKSSPYDALASSYESGIMAINSCIEAKYDEFERV